MKYVVLDTNFLMASWQLKLDIIERIKDAMDEPFECCVLEGTVKELKKLVKIETGKNKDAAKFALALLNHHKWRTLASKGHVDDSLLALDATHVVATMDGTLRSKLRKQGKQTLYIRQKKYIKLQ